MPAYHSADNRVRLRISEIRLHPSISKRDIKAELFVDEAFLKELPVIEGGKPLKWTNLTIIDVNLTSRIKLAVYAKHFQKQSRYDSEPCLVWEVMGLSTKMLKIQDIAYTAEVNILDEKLAEEIFAKSREKLAEMVELGNTNDKLKVTRQMFKSMLEFGSAVAELNPIAKMVFAVCTRAWEEQQSSGEELDDLAGQLVEMAPLVDEVKKYARLEPLRKNIKEFLYMIEDVSIFVLERKTKGFVVQAFRSVFDSSNRDRLLVEQLVKRFQKTKGDFDRAIGVQTMTMVATAAERKIMKQLKPVAPSGHDPSRACQDGTRLGVLRYIDNWIMDQNPSSTFMWIYGQAGIGKSTILTSVCNRLSDRRAPIVSFFCKHDDLALRDPLRLINSVAHGLACRYYPYGKRVIEAIEADPELCTSHLQFRYEGLLKRPLNELRGLHPLPPHIILIDAIDECGANDTRRKLLGYLWEIASLVPWLRFIVTSRPNKDINEFFGRPGTASVSRCDINSYQAANDIRAFIQESISDIATRPGWPADGIDQLCTKAGELFIWAATACKFITEADDTQDRLRQLIDGNTPGGGFDGLDSLYMAVIRNGLADQATDSILNMRRCIGAVVTISRRQPVPIEVLCNIMQPHMNPEALKIVVARLGAVLYSDPHLAGAIRVLHPSFADFVMDKSRSNDFWVDPVQRNIELAVGCMSTMKRELRFNICKLETSHLLNSDVHDLESKIEANVSRQLAYSSIYWINHLVECSDKAAAGQVANIVNSPRLLYWIEVLSVLQKVDVALKGLRELSRWLRSYQQDLAYYVWDTYRFVFAFSDPIIASTPHIYISALPLAPRQSEVSQSLSPLFPNTAVVVKGRDEIWPEWLRSIPHLAPLRALHVSQESQRLVTSCYRHNEPALISMFDVKTGELLRTLKHSSIHHQSLFVLTSPDGSLVASGSAAGKVLFWEAKTGTMIRIIRIDPDTGFVIRSWAFSPDGSVLRLLVVTGTGPKNKIAIWEIGEREIAQIPLPQVNVASVASAAFSPDGTRVAIGYGDGCLVITSWLNPMDTMQLSLSTGSLPSVIMFSPNGTLIATTLDTRSECEVKIWDTKTGEPSGNVMKHTRHVSSIAWSSDGAQMITSAGDSMQMWDVQTCTTVGSPFGVNAVDVITGETFVSFSPDDTYILSGSTGSTKVRMWDAFLGGKPLDNHTDKACSTPKRSGHSAEVESILFRPDGTHIISGSRDGTVRFWDAQTGAPIGEPLSTDGSDIVRVALSLDGARIVAIINCWEKKLYVWDAGTAGEWTRLGAAADLIAMNVHQPPIQRGVRSFALSPDGSHLVAGISDYDPSSTRIEVRNLNTGDMIKSLGHAESFSWPEFITFSLSGSHMFSYHYSAASSSATVDTRYPTVIENRVRIWDANTYNVVGIWDINLGDYRTSDRPSNLQRPRVHTLSPDGTFLVSSFGGTILIHDAYTGKVITTPLLERYHGPGHDVNCVVFSPDGTRMASCSNDGAIRVWVVNLGTTTMGRFIQCHFPVHSVAFSPDGTRLVSGSGSPNIRVWDVSVNGVSNPWCNGNTANWPSNTHLLPPHPTHPGWVSHDQRSLTLWLPDQYRRAFRPNLLVYISESSTVHIDFSKFVHGTSWASVMSEEALRDCN